MREGCGTARLDRRVHLDRGLVGPLAGPPGSRGLDGVRDDPDAKQRATERLDFEADGPAAPTGRPRRTAASDWNWIFT